MRAFTSRITYPLRRDARILFCQQRHFLPVMSLSNRLTSSLDDLSRDAVFAEEVQWVWCRRVVNRNGERTRFVVDLLDTQVPDDATFVRRCQSELLRSPLPILRKNVISRLRFRVAREPTLGVVPLRRRAS